MARGCGDLTDDQRTIMAAYWMRENKRQAERTDLKQTSAPHGAEVDVSPTRGQAAATLKVSRKKLVKATYVLNRDPIRILRETDTFVMVSGQAYLATSPVALH